MKPKVLDLFSGIGGFALAFEAAGFETHAFAEIEPYPCKILAQHWPEVPNLGDVRGINGEDYRGTVDVVCGGFPCQDISPAGKGAGLDGAKSGLWFEMLRIIRGARPDFCLIENSSVLRVRGADVVLEGLEEAGYAARPFVVGAGNACAPHRRARAWVVAYAKGIGRGRAGMPWTGQPVKSKRLGANMVRPWAFEPRPWGVAYGIPAGVHRNRAVGNSIVPAVAYPFACWIKAQLALRPAKPEINHMEAI